jgi:hypothetical protein
MEEDLAPLVGVDRLALVQGQRLPARVVSKDYPLHPILVYFGTNLAPHCIAFKKSTIFLRLPFICMFCHNKYDRCWDGSCKDDQRLIITEHDQQTVQ